MTDTIELTFDGGGATGEGVAFSTDDHEEGVRAFLEDREPEFEGR